MSSLLSLSGRLTATSHQPRGFAKTALAFAVASGLLLNSQVQAQEENGQRNAEAPQVIDIFGQGQGRNPASVKFTRPLLDTAQTINVIPKNLIEQRGATNLRDILRNVSGISMQAGEGGTPSGDQMSIRGFSARTDIFVDNVRDFGGYSRDPFNLEQVEVVKGPSSDYSGRGSTGGSINLVSKAPTLEDINTSSIGFGSDQYARLSLDMNKALPGTANSAVRLNVLYHDQDVPGRNEVSNQRIGIAPSIAFGLQTDTQVTLSLFHLQQDNMPDNGIAWVPANHIALAEYADKAPPVDFDNWYGLKGRDFEEVSTSMATVQFDQVLTSNMRVRNTTRWGLTDRDSMTTSPRFGPDLNSTNIRRSDEKYRDDKDDIISNQTNLTLDINPGENWEHKILMGVEFNLEGEKRYIQAATGTDSPDTDLYNPDPNGAYLENYQRTGVFSTADSTTAALYVSDSIQINEQWQVNGGFRYDNFELEYAPAGGAVAERTDNMLSYRAGLVFKPVEQGTIYLGYGTSFNPSAEALSINTSATSMGIADLDPEENRTTELGVKWELFDRQLLATAAIFRTEKTNARTQDPNDPNDLLVLSGEQVVDGIEVGLAGSLTDTISLFAGYTWLDSEITKSKDLTELGKQLPNSPENSFNLWATWNVQDNVQLGLGAQYLDDRFNSVANTRFAPDYWLYEASASYVVNEKLSFRLNLQNLTDENYADYVAGGHFVPGMGRLAMLSSSFSF